MWERHWPDTAQEILDDAWRLIGLEHQGLGAVAKGIDGDPALLKRFQSFRGFKPQEDAERSVVEKELGEDWLGFYVLGALRRLRQAKAIYSGLRLPDNLFRATMADIQLKMQEYQRIYGRVGLRDDQFDWVRWHLAGEIIRLGRLQFRRVRLDEDSRFGDIALSKGTPLIEVHIPADGPLSPEGCRASYLEARRLFAEVFQFEARGYICGSWLLAHELNDLLPADANILQFAREYQLSSPGWADGSIYHYVYAMDKPDDLKALPDDSLLRRNMKGFLMAGGAIHGRQGFRPLDG